MGSTLTVDTIVGATTAGTVKMPAGNIIQTEFIYVSAETGIDTNNSYTDITGSSVTITPKFSNSKILVETFINVYLGNNVSSTSWNSCTMRLLRGSTVITAPDVAGTNDYFVATYGGDNSREMAYGMLSQIDTPNTTSATTYKLQCAMRHGWDSDALIYVNRYARGMIKATEISV